MEEFSWVRLGINRFGAAEEVGLDADIGDEG